METTSATKVDCPECKGTGKMWVKLKRPYAETITYDVDCVHCAGTGKIEYRDYPKITGRD